MQDKSKVICVQDFEDCPITSISFSIPNEDQLEKYKAAEHVGSNNFEESWLTDDEKLTLL